MRSDGRVEMERTYAQILVVLIQKRVGQGCDQIKGNNSGQINKGIETENKPAPKPIKKAISMYLFFVNLFNL